MVLYVLWLAAFALPTPSPSHLMREAAALEADSGAPSYLPPVRKSNSVLPNLVRSVLLTHAAQTKGARCLDGSPPRFWFQESHSSSQRNRTKWYIHLMGGGWCHSLAQCVARAYSPKQCYRGSSTASCFARSADFVGKPLNRTMDFEDIPAINGARWGGGLLTNERHKNPLTWDWNKVELHYCDGGSFAGDNETVTYVRFGNKLRLPLYFRGRRNMEATIQHLTDHHKLGKASVVIVGGDSAGGLATIWHLDAIQKLLPASVVLGVPDGGWFAYDDSKPEWPQYLHWMVHQMNSTTGLQQSCVQDAQLHGRDPANACVLPEDVSPYVSTPMFVVQSRFDPTNLAITTTGYEKADAINHRGQRMLAMMQQRLLKNKPANVAFITSCSEHCGQWSQGQDNGPKWHDFNVTIDGMHAAQAVNMWYGGLDADALTPGQKPKLDWKQRIWLQPQAYPCLECCNGGLLQGAHHHHPRNLHHHPPWLKTPCINCLANKSQD